MSDTAPNSLMTALLAVQADAPKLQRDKINPAFRSKYLSLDALMEQVLPVLNKHGLVWITYPELGKDGPVLRYELVHAASNGVAPMSYNGEYGRGIVIGGVMPLMLSKQDAQGLGSAITYARRYSLMAVLGLAADEDDDGAKASRPEPVKHTRRPPAPPAPGEQATQVLPPKKLVDASYPENGGPGARLLTGEETERMLKAIAEAKKKPELLFAAVGLDGPDGVTVNHANQIAKLLAG